MKLQCKMTDGKGKACLHVVDSGADPVKGAIQMVMHVQLRHPVVAMSAVNAIAAYVATYFFEPVPRVISESAPVFDLEMPTQEDVYKETRKTLLQGFREWAKTGVR